MNIFLFSTKLTATDIVQSLVQVFESDFPCAAQGKQLMNIFFDFLQC